MAYKLGEIPASGDNDFEKYKEYQWRPAKYPEENVVFLLDPQAEAIGGKWFSNFEGYSAIKTTATWLDTSDPDAEPPVLDPGYELGLKPDTKAWVWVALYEGGKLMPKIWQITEAQYNMIYKTTFPKRYDLAGLCLLISQEKSKKWSITPVPVPPEMKKDGRGSGNNLSPELYEELCNKRFSADLDERVEFVVGMLGPKDADGVKAMLLKRTGKEKWEDVVKYFQEGVAANKAAAGAKKVEKL